MKIGVIGAGSWGTAISALLGKKDYEVRLWAREPEVVEGINSRHANPLYLTENSLPQSVRAVAGMGEAVDGADLVIMATPSHWVGETAQVLAPYLAPDCTVLNLAKGFEQGTGRRLSQVLQEALNPRGLRIVAALAGPNHAEEVIREIPSATVVATPDPEAAARLQRIFHTPYFRVYTSSDLVGVECGAAYKNVVAIAAGMLDGLGLGDNTKATLVTRGLAEMTRYGCKLGARPSTFSGLSGVGDLIVTCFSRHSRNRGFGEQLAVAGRAADELQASSRMVVEGVYATRVVMAMSGSLGIELPVAGAVSSVIAGEKTAGDALQDLMSRGLKEEVEDDLYEGYYGRPPAARSCGEAAPGDGVG